MSRTVAFSRADYDAIVDHAREGAPREVCGVLGGRREDGRARVETVRRADNAAAAPRTTYAIDPAEQLQLMDDIEAAGHEVVGFYHSHPAGPHQPSATDVSRASWPGASYVIVVLDGHPYVGSWHWTGEAFEREAVALA